MFPSVAPTHPPWLFLHHVSVVKFLMKVWRPHKGVWTLRHGVTISGSSRFPSDHSCKLPPITRSPHHTWQWSFFSGSNCFLYSGSFFPRVLTCGPLGEDWTGRGCGEQPVVTGSRGSQEKAGARVTTRHRILSADWSDLPGEASHWSLAGCGSQSWIRHAVNLSQSQISIVNPLSINSI